MLQAARRKPKKRKTKVSYERAALPKTVQRHINAHALHITLCQYEYFEAMHEALDWIEDHCPDTARLIKPELDRIDELEMQWLAKVREGILPDATDRDSLKTYAARHFYKKELVDYREKLRRAISMRAVRNHHKKPHLMGTSLLVLIAGNILRNHVEMQLGKLKQHLSTLVDITTRKQYVEFTEKKATIKDWDKPMTDIVEKLRKEVGMDEKTYEEYYMNKKIAQMIYDYSVVFNEAYMRDEIIATYEMCHPNDKAV